VTGLVFLTQDGDAPASAHDTHTHTHTSMTRHTAHIQHIAGQLQHQVVSPNRKARKRLGKTYVIKAWRDFKGDEAEIFKAGTLLLNGETKPCRPADLEILDPVNNLAKYRSLFLSLSLCVCVCVCVCGVRACVRACGCRLT